LSYGASVSDAVSVPADISCPIGIEFPTFEYPNVQAIQQTGEMASALGSSIVVVRTGFYDVITQAGRCFLFGGPQLKKRCRNYGDLYAGLTSVILAWQKLKNVTNRPMAAACIADVVLRLAILDSCSPCKAVASVSDVVKCIPEVIRNIEDIFQKVDSSPGTSTEIVSTEDTRSRNSANFLVNESSSSRKGSSSSFSAETEP